MKVVVVGGGLAGLAAALECADAGAAVTLLEARPRLGGATFSIQRNGYWLDNGQHVALRCCTEYRAFLGRIGSEHLLAIQPRLDIPVLGEHGSATLSRSRLPAPFHLVSTLLRYGHLSPRERLAAFRAAAALRTLDPKDAQLDQQTFGGWLRAHGQSKRAISALWDLIALPTLNLHAHSASLMLAAKVFRTGLLDEADACDVAVPTVPLQHLHGDPARTALEARGARVVLSARVDAIDPDLRVHLAEGVEEADAVVVAVPHRVAAAIAPPGVLHPSTADGLGASPIVNLHLHYDRRVLDEPFAAAVDSPVQWIFDRTKIAGVDTGQFLSISLSGAEDEIGVSQAELRARYVPALERLLPATREAALLDFFATREPSATFKGVPGTHSLRPPPQTIVAGLYLAGAWTDTGWPATMEGAVRSGLAAGRAALAAPRAAERRVVEVA